MEYNNLRNVLNRLSPILISLYRQNIDSTGTTATGKLANNISFEVVQENNLYAVDFFLEDYWKYVEFGRRPGKWPNIKAIENWIKVKRIAPRFNNLTYLISRKIALKGIEPKELLTKSIDTFQENYIELIEEAITKDIAVELDKNLNKV